MKTKKSVAAGLSVVVMMVVVSGGMILFASGSPEKRDGIVPVATNACESPSGWFALTNICYDPPKFYSITNCNFFWSGENAIVVTKPDLPDGEEWVHEAVVSKFVRIETNWVEAGATSTLMWPPEANTVTFMETGTVSSNTYLRVRWDKHVFDTLLGSKPFSTVNRSYVNKTVREYIR